MRNGAVAFSILYLGRLSHLLYHMDMIYDQITGNMSQKGKTHILDSKVDHIALVD